MPKISKRRPVIIGASPQPITKHKPGHPEDARIQPRVQAGPYVTLFSYEPKIAVTARLRGPVAPPVPRPKISVADRPGEVGLTHYDGRDPYQQTLPVMFDLLARDGSIEDDRRRLEWLSLPHKGHKNPPVVQLTGPVPDPTGVSNPRWWIESFEEIQSRTAFNSDGHRSRWAVDVHLIERVGDTTLQATLDRTASAEGIDNAKITVRRGETTFHKVSKRVYGDRSHALRLARANGMLVTTHLKAGTKLRRP